MASSGCDKSINIFLTSNITISKMMWQLKHSNRLFIGKVTNHLFRFKLLNYNFLIYNNYEITNTYY